MSSITVMLEKIRNYLVYLFLFLLPWQTRLILRSGELNGGYWEYGTISIYATEILLWLALAIYIATKIRQGKNFKFYRNYWLPFFIYILIVGSLALHPRLHFYYLFHFIEGAGLYFLIKSVDFRASAAAFILGILPQALLGIWQFLTQTSFANKWLGLAAHDPSVLGTFVVETMSGRWLRAIGALPHPNILGGYIVVAMLIIFWLVIKDEYLKNMKQFSIFNFQFSILVLIILFGSALFFTFSRSAWLALFIGLLIYWFIAKNKKFLILNSLFFILIFLILGIIFREPLLSRVQSQNRLEIKSNIERLSGAQESWRIFRHHPLVGVGLGNYTYALWKEIDGSRPSYAYQPVHNIFLLLLAEIGAVGVLLLLGLLIYLVKNKSPIRNSLFFIPHSLFLILFLGFFDHYLLTLYPGIMLLFFSFASLTQNRIMDSPAKRGNDNREVNIKIPNTS